MELEFLAFFGDFVGGRGFELKLLGSTFLTLHRRTLRDAWRLAHNRGEVERGVLALAFLLISIEMIE
jgi:hypothetical protein